MSKMADYWQSLEDEKSELGDEGWDDPLNYPPHYIYEEELK
jgi:hypothetical protein